MNYPELIKSLTNITPDKEKIERIEDLREAYKRLSASIYANCDDSSNGIVKEYFDIAIKDLQTSLMWAVKSIIMEESEDKND